MSSTIILAVLLGLIGVVAAALVYGAARWRSATKAMRARLEAARRPIRPAKFNSKELTGLPVPVQRYFRTVLADGQPMIATRIDPAEESTLADVGVIE